MSIRKNTARKGFTLIELLTVITIIGILAAILIPTIGGVIKVAQKSAAQSNAHQIAQTYISYSTGSANPRTIQTTDMGTGGPAAGVATDIEDVAFILAKFNQLNDASLWYVKQDEALNGVTLPKSVITGDPDAATTVAADFAKVSPKSWAFVIGLSTNANASTTPVLWTYGLGHDGKWVKNSPWGGTGGHIAFLDGHVTWADNLSTAGSGISFVSYQQNSDAGTPSIDYAKAINSLGSHPAKVVNTTGQSGQ
ncbi:MAG TPA: prepilin-type N-terminal cleavage/methylation domain-containing protein [Opitutales bacterium]|jgi:prepilin-type N-terminal cleavage/methylation domain-containing protein/prepilin-type processing-associated H-X9-DG protein|nr:prepilin-type N-terminal cleavage/methylation domain-containing protein [Opitutales bacterium]